MVRIARLTWCLVVVAGAAHAGGLELLGEVRFEDQGRSFRPLSAERYVEVGRDWEPGDQKARLGVFHYKVLDAVERRIVRVSIPLEAVRAANPKVLGERATPTLVHYDGAVSTVLFPQFTHFKVVATWLAQFDHRTGRFTELVRLGEHDGRRITGELDFDPTDRFLYCAEFIDEAGDVMKHKPTSLRLFRVRLDDRRVDWELDLVLPKRTRPLAVKSWHFDREGKRLALVEYDDKAGQNQGPVTPQAQVYVVDVETKAIDTYPIPLSAYGVAFTPDGKYLLLGSNELGELVRIDLAAKKVDATAKGHKLMHAFAMAPSGRTFLVFSNTELASPKVVESRRVDTLKLAASIPVRLLTPGTDNGPTRVRTVQGGKVLFFPGPEEKAAPNARSIRFFAVPDEVDQDAVAGAAAGAVSVAKGVVAARAQAAALGLEVRDDPRTGDPKQTFAGVSVNAAGEAFLLGIRSGNSDGDYQPGRTTPIALKVDAKGKLAWQRPLPGKGFTDYEAGGVAVLPDGGCVVHVLSYVAPGGYAVTRFLRLDAKGKTLWDYRFRGAGGLNTPVADRVQLLPSGGVHVEGRVATAKDVEKKWSAELDAKGKVLFDRVEE